MVYIPKPRSSRPSTLPRRALRTVSNGQLTLDNKPADDQKTPTKVVRHCKSAHSLSAPSKISRFLASGHPNRRSNTIRNAPSGKTGPIAYQRAVEVSDRQPDTAETIRGNGENLPDIPDKDAPGHSAYRHDDHTIKIHDRVRSSSCGSEEITVGMAFGEHVPCVQTVEMQTQPDVTPIHGLGLGLSCPHDSSLPVVRPYPEDRTWGQNVLGSLQCLPPLVQHVDVSTVWNGLTEVQAEGLFEIHKAFVASLQTILAHQLRQLISEPQDRPWQSFSNANIGKSDAAVTDRCIAFCRTELIEEMTRILYEYPQDDNKAQIQLASIELYLASTDCFMEFQGNGRHDTSLLLRLQYQAPESPEKYMQAAWIPDDVLFPNLNGFPREGEEFWLFPQYQCNSVFRDTCFPTNVIYSLETPCHWLSWDDQKGGFKGLVPIYSALRECHKPLQGPQNGANPILDVIELIVRSTLIEYAIEPDAPLLRFERTIRTRLTIRILPWYSGKISAIDEMHRKPRIYENEEPNHRRDPFGLGPARKGSLSILNSSVHLSQQKPIDMLQDIDQRVSSLENGDASNWTNPNIGQTIHDTTSIRLARKHAWLAQKHKHLAKRYADAGNFVLDSSFFQDRPTDHKDLPPTIDATADCWLKSPFVPAHSADGNFSPAKKNSGLSQNRSDVELFDTFAPPSPTSSGEESASVQQHSSSNTDSDKTLAPSPPLSHNEFESKSVPNDRFSQQILDNKARDIMRNFLWHEDSNTQLADGRSDPVLNMTAGFETSKTSDTLAPIQGSGSSPSLQKTKTLASSNQSGNLASTRVQSVDDAFILLDAALHKLAKDVRSGNSCGYLNGNEVSLLKGSTAQASGDSGDCWLKAKMVAKHHAQGDAADVIHDDHGRPVEMAPTAQDEGDNLSTKPGYSFFNSCTPLRDSIEGVTSSASDLSDDACMTIRPIPRSRQQRVDVRDFFQPPTLSFDDASYNTITTELCDPWTASCEEVLHSSFTEHDDSDDCLKAQSSSPSVDDPFRDQTSSPTILRASTLEPLHHSPTSSLKKKPKLFKKWCTCAFDDSESCHICKDDQLHINRYLEDIQRLESQWQRHKSRREKKSEEGQLEPRLSRDEQIAMEEAKQRSLEGRSASQTMQYNSADAFDDIFEFSSDEDWNAADNLGSGESDGIPEEDDEKATD